MGFFFLDFFFCMGGEGRGGEGRVYYIWGDGEKEEQGRGVGNLDGPEGYLICI